MFLFTHSAKIKKHLLMSIPDLFPENEGKNAEDFKIMHEPQKLLTDKIGNKRKTVKCIMGQNATLPGAPGGSESRPLSF